MIGVRKVWIGFAISIPLLALFFVTVDVSGMVDELAGANYLFLIPGIVLYLMSVLFRTIRWQVLLRHMRPVSVWRLYPVVVVGYMANNLLPMRLGELVRSYYVGEREGISKTSALSTILVERVLDALTLLFFISVIALFVPLAGLANAFREESGIPGPLLVLALTVPFVSAFGFGSMFLVSLYPGRTRAAAMVFVRWLPRRFESPVRGLVDLLLHGLIPLRSPRKLALVFLMSAPIWLLESGLFFFIGFSLGLDQAFNNLGEMAVAMVLVTAIANIASSPPLLPGGIVLFEVVTVVTLETLVVLPLAVGNGTAGSFAVLVHASLLVPMIILGQLFLWTSHISLRSLSRGDRVTPSQTGFSSTRLSLEKDDSA